MKPRKYRNTPVEVDGHRFDSKREAKRYGELMLLQRDGVISDLELQPRFKINVNGVKVATYVADFRYVTGYVAGDRCIKGGATVVEDVKGVKTPVYKLKKKLVEALYPVTIVEV